MKKSHSIYILFTVLVNLLICGEIKSQDNPFLQMANQKYADYSAELYDGYLNTKISGIDTVEGRKIVRQMNEAAQKIGSTEWKLITERAEIELYARKSELYGETLFPFEKVLNDYLNLLEKTKKANFKQLELQIRFFIIRHYWLYVKNYESAFEHCDVQSEELQKISIKDCPEKTIYYLQIANYHYAFKDYATAILYFQKVLDEQDNFRSRYSKQHARNGMGLIYRAYNDLESSDSCFRLLLKDIHLYEKNDIYAESWKGISNGNIGENMLTRGDFDKAIPLLENSLEIMVKVGELGYASGPAVNLADIYVKKGNLKQAKFYLDLAQQYHNFTFAKRKGRQLRIYEVLSKYYAATGNTALSITYTDSTRLESEREEKEFSTMLLMRIEQQKHLAEQQKKEEHLYREKLRSENYLKIGIIIFVMLLLVCAILCYTIIIYRKKKAAYIALAEKLQEWAQDKNKNIKKEKPANQPDEIDLSIMQEIDQLMLKEKLYKDTSLLCELLAQRLDTKPYLVSDAIRHCTNKNFNTYINEYRIKEAIRLMSEKNNNLYSIDSIAFKSGFNDRRNFSRVFKKITGMSPTEFINTLGK